MCTVSWVHEEDGYQLLCNRDEKRTRTQALSPETKRGLLQVYETWKAVRFPPLLDQLKRHYEGRLAIDRAIAQALGLPENETGVSKLYDRLALRIEGLRDLMGRD